MNYEKIFGAELAEQVKSALEKLENIRIIDVTDGSYVEKAAYEAGIEKAKAEAAKNMPASDDAEKIKAENDTLRGEIDKLKFSSAYELKLATSGAKSAKALRGMIDASKVTLGEDGVLQGYDEQLESVKSECPWLFEAPSSQGLKHGAAEPAMDGVEKAFRDKNKDLKID